MTAPDVSGWSHGVLHKVSLLVMARLLTQVIGIGWFLVVARIFDADELGMLAAGLMTFAAVSVVGDLGTTWSIAREVTSEPTLARPLYDEGVRLRLVGVMAIGLPVLAAGAFLVEERVFAAMAIGVAIAVFSGVTEIGLATLRAVGAVRLESLALPGERLAFVALASVALLAGGGAAVVLGAYLVTNSGSALLTRRAVHRLPIPESGAAQPRLWGVETRRVGVAFAILALGPRASGLILVMLATSTEVADYSVASRPVEQLALAVFGFSTTMLPLLRDDHVAGRSPGRRAGTVAASVAVVALPTIALAVLSADRVVDLVYGADRYPGAATTLALVALVTITWPVRGLTGMLMVARSRATALARITGVGLLASVILSVPLAMSHGASGTAAALLVTEVATVAALVARSGIALPTGQGPRFLITGGLGVAAGSLAAVAPMGLAIVLVVVATAVAGVVALDAHRTAARRGEVIWS